MSGKATRSKGRRGESEAKTLLTSRDWIVSDLASGLSTEDLLATDTNGVTWSVEVKNCKNILHSHKQQAIENSHKTKLPWMLISKIAFSSGWLIQRQGMNPVVWCKNEDK